MRQYQRVIDLHRENQISENEMRIIGTQLLLQLLDQTHQIWVGGCSSNRFPTIQSDTANSVSSNWSSFRPFLQQFARHSSDLVDFSKIDWCSLCRHSTETVCVRHSEGKTHLNRAILTELCATCCDWNKTNHSNPRWFFFHWVFVLERITLSSPISAVIL